MLCYNKGEDMKLCSKCLKAKKLEEFHNNRGSKDGKESHCKVCVSERRKQYRQENRDKISEYAKQYVQNLPSMIYEIHNTITKQIYVGQTSTGRMRWSRHKSNLRKGIHGNPLLQKDWDKWGKDAFRFNVVEELPCDFNKEQLLEKEAALMLEHISNGVKLYNEDIPE